MTASSLLAWRTASKRVVRNLMPLSVRKRAALALQRQTWLAPQRRHWWGVELVRDLADTDLDAFHEFLWTHHLGYAATYEVAERFGSENVKASRHIFFADLVKHLDKLDVYPHQIDSVFEVGCSLGYQLRFMETDVFQHATRLEGIDLDRHAVRSGSEYLRHAGSKVAVQCADVSDLEKVIGGNSYDLIVCTGVLMYLNEARAAEAVRVMLRHARGMVALAGLAHPGTDNADLTRSDMRESDRTFVHNLDRMVKQAGGIIRARRWEGSRDVEGNTIYFIFATGCSLPQTQTAGFVRSPVPSGL